MLKNAVLKNVHFEKCDFRGADFDCKGLETCKLMRVTIDDIYIPKKSIFNILKSM